MISKSSETEFPLGGQAQLDNAPASDHLLLESPPTSDSNRDAEDSPPSGQPSSANDREALYDRNFFVALVSQTSFVIANTLLAHYARWIEFLGGNLQQVGWVMGIGAASGLVLRPFLAQCINRLGAKTTWGLGYVIFAVAAAANYFLVDIDASLFLLRALSVLGSALVFASSLTYISQVAPESRRTEAIGTLGCGGFLGMLVGPVLGDFFLQAEVRSRPEFMTLFFVAAAANIVPLALLYSLRSPNPSNLQKHKMQPQSWGSGQFFKTVIQYWPGRIVYVDLVFGVCMTVPFVFLASYVDEMPIRLDGVSEIGYFFWFYAGFGLLFRVGLRELPDRIGAERVLKLGLLTTGLGLLLFLIVTPEAPWRLAFPAALTGLGHGLTFHTMTSMTIAPFPPALRGTASALALMLLDLGTLLGAPLLGFIGEQLGYSALFGFASLLCLGTLVYVRNVPAPNEAARQGSV